MKEVISFIKKNGIGKYKENIGLKNYTTYKVGGNAKVMVYPKNVDKLILLLKELNEKNVKYKVLGNGSNLIFSDKEYDGVIIKLDELDKVSVNDTIIKVEAGYSLVKLSYLALKHGLSGLEFASGIPGTIGGAIFMNAGAYKSDMGYIVSEVKVITDRLEVKTLYNKDLNYKYRSSFLKDNPKYICLEATIVLKHEDKSLIRDLMETRKQKRLISQPLEYPSAGSVFRNPDNDFAGKLIEDLGLKGYSIGGAQVSLKHANFIINKNNATGEDVLNLINLAKKEIKEKFDIELKQEQELFNFD